MSAQMSAVMYRAGMYVFADSKEEEVGKGPTILQMARGSPFNEFLLGPAQPLN